MPSILSLTNLPREIIYLIFEYLNKKDIAYTFFELNQYFQLSVKYFLGNQLNLNNISNQIHFQYCLTNVLPSIGINLQYLSIGSSYSLFNYIKFIENYCPNLAKLDIYCSSQIEDIRYYAMYSIHHQLKSLILMYNKKIVGEEIAHRLINQYETKESCKIQSTSSLILHLSSLNDLILLKRYSESSYLDDGLYMIECVSTGQWLTESKDDLCIMSMKLHRDSIFSIKKIDQEDCFKEYELYNEGTQHKLSVLIPSEEERWISSSILSTQRKQSSRSCSNFIFEKIENDNQYYIRPCYTNAKRLQTSGKRIIISLCDNENTLNHCFKLHRIL